MSDETATPLTIDPATCALLVIDVLEGGFLDSDQTAENRAFGKACAEVARLCRGAGIPVIFCCDAHIEGLDKELDLWGPHGVAGAEGSKPARLLGGDPSDITIPKRRYSGFFETDLDLTLRELGVSTVIAIGSDTNICVLHTLADAYYRTYASVVVKEATMTFLVGTQEGAFEHMERCFGTRLVSLEELRRALA